jgi:hypothetical protein
MNTDIHFLVISRSIFLNEKCSRQKLLKIKTRILCSVTFFERCDVYEIMWKNIVEPDRPQMTVWCLRIACWIPKAANTHRLCNTHSFSTATLVT